MYEKLVKNFRDTINEGNPDVLVVGREFCGKQSPTGNRGRLWRSQRKKEGNPPSGLDSPSHYTANSLGNRGQEL